MAVAGILGLHPVPGGALTMVTILDDVAGQQYPAKQRITARFAPAVKAGRLAVV